jgi:hypothetical protein
MKVAGIAMGVLAVLALALYLELRPESHDEQSPAQHPGPSSVMRAMRRRQAAQAMKARQDKAGQLGGALPADAGAGPANP